MSEILLKIPWTDPTIVAAVILGTCAIVAKLVALFGKKNTPAPPAAPISQTANPQVSQEQIVQIGPDVNDMRRELERFQEPFREELAKKIKADTSKLLAAYLKPQESGPLPPADTKNPIETKAIALFDEGRELQRSNADHLAVHKYRAAIELDPTLVPAYLNLGGALFKLGDIEGAVEVWSQVIGPTEGNLE